MKYYVDTEFLEGQQKKFFGKTKPTIDLISIGMVDENGREFYAISKEFNLKEAWNRHEIKCVNDGMQGREQKVYWIRENVLRPIYNELLQKERYARENHWKLVEPFSYKTMKNLIAWNGKSNIEIANGICAFIYGDDCGGSGESAIEMACKYEVTDKSLNPEFYGYYADYDWVVFCWLFGNMMKLPKGFPMYCVDLKQIIDEKARQFAKTKHISYEQVLSEIKSMSSYPKQENEHNALADAKWNKEFHEFLNTIH